MKVDEQLCAEAELILPKVGATSFWGHAVHSHLLWYRNACRKNDKDVDEYERWLRNSLKKAKEVLAEQRYKENEIDFDI